MFYLEKNKILLTMKYLLPVFILFVFVNTAFTQVVSNEQKESTQSSSNEMEFFKMNRASHGIYLGLGGGYARLNSSDFVTLNARLAYVYNNVFEIGLASKLLQNHDNFNSNQENVEFIAGSFGGLHLKGIILGNKKVHLSVPVFLGGGAVGLFESQGSLFSDCFDPENKEWAGILVMDAGLNVEFNISKILGFELGGMYRITSQADFLEEDNLNGLLLSATLKVGYFDFGRKSKRIKTEPKFDSDYLEY